MKSVCRAPAGIVSDQGPTFAVVMICAAENKAHRWGGVIRA